MNNTLAFEEMNLIQQIDELSDMLGEACFAVADCVAYRNMTGEEKAQVKDGFLSTLKNNNIQITESLIDAVEKEYPTSPMASLLRQYKYYTQGEFQQATEQLTEGRKVTIVKFSDFGFPVVMNAVIDKVVVERYAQYTESLEIVHKPKRKRSLYSTRIFPKDSMLVYEGWLDIDTDSLTSTIVKQDQHVTVRQSKYRSFDKQFIQDAIESISGNLILKLNVTK